MTDLDSVHAQDANISWADKLTHRRALEQVLWAKSAGCKKVAATTAKSSENVDVSKLISRAKDAGKVSGGIFKGSQDTRSVAVFLDEVDSMDEYACGSDAYKYFYLRASLDEDIRGYVNKEVKAKINKEGVTAENWQRKLSLLRSILLEEYTVLSSDLATQLEWDKLTYTPGSTRMESHLTRLLTLADRVSMSRGSEVSDRELRSKLYVSLPTATQRWIDSLGSSAVASYAAMRREVRRWAQYNEKPVGSSRRSTSAPRGGRRVQVSAANAAEENDIEVGLSIALGDMDKDACWRCGLKGHRAFECRGKVYQPDKRCPRCGSFDHDLSRCPLSASTICGRCKQPGHYSATCDAELPVKRFNTRGGRGRRNPPVMVVTAEGDTGGTSDSVPAACDSSGSADCTSVPVMQVDLMAVGACSDGEEPLEVKIVPPAELCVDVAGKSVKFLIDSGAGLNFISEALAT